MKIQSTVFGKTMFAGLVASFLMAFAGSATAESWDTFKSNYDYHEAVHYMNNGYTNLGKVANKLNEGNGKSAERHFNWALKDFSKAVEFYAKAELPAAEKDAVEALKKGLDALKKAVKAIEKNDVVAAQNNFDLAQDYFAQANILAD